MKTILKNYSFNTATKAITLTDIGTVRLDRLALITDVTTNKILYNFADTTVATATVATNVVTLSALQGGENNADKLRIDYDVDPTDTAFGDSTEATEITKLNGTTIDTNSGSKSAGTQRVVLATDQPQLTNALKVDGSAVTQPVSGTVAVSGTVTVDSELTTADVDTGAGTDTRAVVGLVGTKSGGGVLIPGDATKGLAVDLTNTGANATAIKTDGSAVTQPVSGTVTANAGTNLNTSALALESGGNLASIKTDADNLNLAQGSTTSGQKGNLGLGAVTTAAPSYTTAQSNPLSLTTSGALRTDGSATTQPVSGTVTANIGTAGSLALDSTLTGGTQQAKLTDGTNIANVLKSDGTAAGQNALIAAGGYRESTGLTAAALNADLVASTDVSNYKWFSLHITTATSYVGTLTFQASNDNSTWINFSTTRIDQGANSPNSAYTSTNGIIVHAAIAFRYLRVRMTSYTSGTATGVLELYTQPATLNTLGISAAQNGNWTVLPGNTVNTSPWLVRDGGTTTSSIAAGTSGNTVIKASSGTLARILVTATGTNPMNFYDNASTNSGTVIGALPASPAIGTVLILNMPAANGITAGGNASNPGVTVAYN